MLGDSTHFTGKVDYSQPKLGFEELPELEKYVSCLYTLRSYSFYHL